MVPRRYMLGAMLRSCKSCFSRAARRGAENNNNINMQQREAHRGAVQ